MANLYLCCNSLTPNPTLPPHAHNKLRPSNPESIAERQGRRRATAVFAAKSGGYSLNSMFKRCETCGGKGAIECPGCKGAGKNKKNGNIFERWKCFDCQGFGLKSCPNCGKGGLTPEQRGER
ncbi:hypothetical protein TIFTF001_047859 [Ficus carica]|uniref:Uncharacterized protein n=1 Tax=Ficus carica TaxID=3494 RepID=A0AA87ZNC2_FICCA|nr:hypothetical protein TIFTF001_047859 [Ficus carica]